MNPFEALPLNAAPAGSTGAALLLAEAESLRVKGDYLDALRVALKASEMATIAADGDVLAASGSLITLMHCRMRNLEAAISAGRLALPLQRQARAERAEVETLTTLALACASLQMFQEALGYINAAIAGAKRLDDDRLLCWALNRAGCIHGEMADFGHGMRSIASALELARSLNQFEELFSVLHNRAGIESREAESCELAGDAEATQLHWQATAQTLLEAAAVAHLHGKHLEEASALTNLVKVQIQLNALADAAATVARCSELLSAGGLQWLRFDLDLCELELALAHGFPAAALERLDQLVRSAEWVERSAEHTTDDELAYRCYEQVGQFEKALHHLKRLRELERKGLLARANAQTRLLTEQLALDQAHREADRARTDLMRQTGIAAGLLQERQALELRATTLQQQAHKDPLTGLANRRVIDEALPKLMANAPVGESSPLSVVMLDVDHFKSVNDSFGHAVGDLVLQRLADVLRACTRDSDVVARWGGEEFMLLSASTPANAVEPMCQRLRAMVQEQDWASIRPGLAVTISLGYGLAAAGEEPGSLVSRVDQALYAAKAAGRNRVAAAKAGSC